MNADGGDQRRLTTRYGVVDSPSLSPDGQWVVYAESGFGGSHIEIQQIDGSDRRSLVRNGGYASDPEFSPDGKHIVYSQGGIYVVPLEGGRIHRLTRRNGLRPDYSPDGSHIVFYEHLGKRLKTFVMRADGSHLHSVPCSSRTPAYSPNGNRLAFSVGAKPTGTDIWTTRLSKPCNRRAVTHLPGAAFDPSWQPLLAG
jgi:TolB protein